MRTQILYLKTARTGFLCFILILVLNAYVFGQSESRSGLPVRSRGQLVFDVDIYQYQGNQGKTVVEIAYSLNLSGLSAKHSAADSNVVLKIDYRLIKSGEKSLTKLNERKEVLFSSLGKNSGDYNLIDMKRFEFYPQLITLELTIKDSASGMTGRIVYPFKIRKFDNSFSISDLFFVSNVQKSEGKSIFKKHGVFLIPNPSRTFYARAENPKLFVYYEINNFVYKVDSQSNYRVDYTVYGLDGKEIIPLFSKIVLKAAPFSARVEVIPLKSLGTGVYKLMLSVTDVESSVSQTVVRYFQVYAEDDNDNLILPMTSQDVKKYLDQIKYIASDMEVNIFKKLNARGKQQFLLNFWRSRDPDPLTPENEFMEEHFRRLAYCNSHFQGGSNSDMGRIYILYGPPVDIQRDFSSIEFSKPVIIWTYAIDGRSEFVFADRSGDGKYVLVHSTYRDEYSNPNWMEDLKQSINRK